MQKPVRKSTSRLTRLRLAAQTARTAVRSFRQSLPQPVRRILRRVTHWTLHSTLGVLISIVLIFVAAHLWLPTLAERKGEIETYISLALGNPVKLSALDTYWDGLNPGVRVQGLRVQSAATGQQAIRLREMRLSLGWWPLLTGRIEISSLVLVEPSLTVERQADGRLRISGLEATTTPAASDTDFSQLLLSQKEMIIENGELLWLDRLAGADAESLSVRHVHLGLRNDGDRHRLEFRADFPQDLCADCRVSADIHGNPFRETSWRGEIGVQARALSVRGLPRVLREPLPPSLAGRFDLRLTSQWRDARPETVEGRVAVSALSLPLPGETQPMTVQALDAKLKWNGSAEAWRLDLASLRLGLTRAAWPAGRLRLDVQPDRVRFEVEHMDVADLAAFTATLPREHALLGWLRAAQPAGNLNRLRFELAGPVTAPTRYSADGELRDIRFAAHERIPGLHGLSGQLSLDGDGGEFRLDSGDLRVALPILFKEPLTLQRLSSRIRWRRNPEDWFVQAQDIVLDARDGRARGDIELRVPKDSAISPVLKLRADFSDGDGSHTARYIPLTMPDALRAWIERAVVTGRVTDGSVLYHGALRNFPFRDGKGRFEVRAHVKDGVLDYLPGWAPIHDIDADLYFTGTGMLATSAHSKIRGLDVGRLAVAIEDFKAPDGAMVTVNGRIAGRLQETLDVLTDSKAPRLASLVPAGLRAAGDGALTLDLRIPARAPKAIAIAGFYRFLNSSVELPFRAIRVDNIQGGMEFSEAGLRAGKITARLLGGDTVLEAVPDATQSGAARVEAHGTLTQAGIAQVFGPELSRLVRGQAPWQARLLPQRDASGLFIEADLRDLDLRLPAPLAKAQGEPLLLHVHTSAAGIDSQVLDLQMAERVTGKLAFQRAASGWIFTRGRIGVGEKVTQLPPQSGLQLSLHLPALNADDWWPLLRRNLSDGGDSGWLDRVSRVNADVESLDAFGRGFGRLSLDLGNNAGNWQGRMQGDAVTGQLAITRPAAIGLPLVVGNVAAPGRSAIHLTLENLVLPPARVAGAELTLDPRDLPPLHVQSQSFTVADKLLGALEFSALPATYGWKIASLKLTRPESSLTASGLWEINSRNQQSSQIDATLTSTDVGTLLETLGYGEEIVGGKITLQSNWSWPGAPASFRLAQTDGHMTFTLANGRIPKISPGAGRLLGALDLRSVTRYLMLDFSNVFGKGLSFDTIKGRVAVEKGNAYTRDLAIRTPGADMGLSGRIGLAARDLDLELEVTPRLMGELAVAGGLLGGPVVGAAVAVLHKLVQKPFEKSTRINYTVKGGWDDLAVTRLGPPPTAPAGADQQATP
jgi:uncharacterized protein (TIGR02099 family)